MRRGCCSVCGAPYVLRQDGMVRVHDNGLILDPSKRRMCAGSGHLPVRTEATS